MKISKQDRQGARTPAALDQRYDFGAVKKQSEKAYQAAMDAQKSYDGLSHEQIFNLLTNNGELEGLYEVNGQIYLNASYIKSGELSANLIKTGVIKSSNYAELEDGTPSLGMAIDLDNGIINSPKFKLNNLGEITAIGGFLGEFEITEAGLSKVMTDANDDRGIYTDSISINPSIITMTRTFESAAGEQDNYTAKTSILSGRLEIEETHGGSDFYGTLFSYTENGDTYSIYIDQASGTVKAKLMVTGA